MNLKGPFLRDKSSKISVKYQDIWKYDASSAFCEAQGEVDNFA